MANLLLFIFSYLPLLFTHFRFQAQGLALPVTKDPSTLQYITRVHLGTTTTNHINLVLDLGGPFLWATGRCSSSGDPIRGTSLHCAKAKANQPSGTRTPICHLPTLNTITGAEAGGQLVEDELTLGMSKVNGFLFSCAPAFLLAGLAGGSGGMLGLGRGSRIGPLSQVVPTGRRKFFTCFSSSTGVLLLGDEEVNALQASETISKSTLYTPLVPGPSSSSSSHDYFINVKSIRVNGERLPVEGNIGIAKISSVVPYTALSSSVYGAFVKAYELAAASMNMTRVAPVSPFGLCFNSQAGGPLVIPSVDFMLQSEMVKWRVNERNTMAEAGGGVVCLGFLDGGSAMDSEVVIGGLQLEDNLLEFNLGTNLLGFENFLSENRAFSCSDFVSRPSLLVNE